MRAPGPLFVPPPEAPRGLALKGWYSNRMKIEVLVSAEGRIRSPVVLEGDMPAKIYLGLEALHRWRLEPARFFDRPVATLLTLDGFTVPRSFAFLATESGELRGPHELLTARRWQQALTMAEGEIALVLEQRDDRFARSSLGLLTALRALAEAGLGEVDEAIWHWRVAQVFLPGIEGFDFGAYGAAGRLLEQNPRRCDPSAPQRCDALDLTDLEDPHEPPDRIPAPPVRLRPEVLPELASERLAVRLVVGADGRPREPLILAGPSPTAAYEALEAIRTWRFRPAIVGGRPVAALHEMAVPLPADTPARHRRPAEDAWTWGPASSAAKPDAAGEEQAPAGPLHVAGDVQKPIKLVAPQPEYSVEARQFRTQGVVVVQTVIDRNGLVRDVRVLEGLPDGLSEQTVAAIHRWRFLPATLDGTPVDAYYNLTVSFRLP